MSLLQKLILLEDLKFQGFELLPFHRLAQG
jgi:hypothetical protein